MGWAEPVEVIGTEGEDQVELEDEIVRLDLTQNRIRQIQDPSSTEMDPEEFQLARSRVVDGGELDFLRSHLESPVQFWPGFNHSSLIVIRSSRLGLTDHPWWSSSTAFRRARS